MHVRALLRASVTTDFTYILQDDYSGFVKKKPYDCPDANEANLGNMGYYITRMYGGTFLFCAEAGI